MDAENLVLKLTSDEALVLFEFLHRFEESDELSLEHVAEYIALLRVSAQLDKSLVAPFDPAYVSLLEGARARLSAGFEGEYPGALRDAP